MRLFEKHDDYIFSCILATDAAVCVCVCVYVWRAAIFNQTFPEILSVFSLSERTGGFRDWIQADVFIELWVAGNKNCFW